MCHERKVDSNMTERLEQVIARLKILPTDKQDAIATLILEELEDDQRWDSNSHFEKNKIKCS